MDRIPNRNSLLHPRNLALAVVAATTLLAACTDSPEGGEEGVPLEQENDTTAEVTVVGGNVQIPEFDREALLGSEVVVENEVAFSEYMTSPERNIGLTDTMVSLTETLQTKSHNFNTAIETSDDPGSTDHVTVVFTPKDEEAYQFTVAGVESASGTEASVRLQANKGDGSPVTITPLSLEVVELAAPANEGQMSRAWINRSTDDSTAATGYESVQFSSDGTSLEYQVVGNDSFAAFVGSEPLDRAGGKGGGGKDTALAYHTDQRVADYIGAAINAS